MNELPETIFGEKVHYYPTNSIEDCKKHADNFIILFPNLCVCRHVVGYAEVAEYNTKGMIAAWFEGGYFSGWGEFCENFEKEYDYKSDFKPYTFFVYHEKAKIL